MDLTRFADADTLTMRHPVAHLVGSLVGLVLGPWIWVRLARVVVRPKARSAMWKVTALASAVPTCFLYFSEDLPTGVLFWVMHLAGVAFWSHRYGRTLPAEEQSEACHSCGALGRPGAGFCRKCGASLVAVGCPGCRKTNAPDATFCEHCGAKISN